MTKLLNNKIFRGSILGLMILCMVVVAVFFSFYDTAATVKKGSTKNEQCAAIYYSYTQNEDTCKTTLKVRLRVYSSGSDYSTHKDNADWSLTYNGTTKSGSYDYKKPSSGSYVNVTDLYEKTITQTNGASKDISMSGYIDLTGTSVGKKLSVSTTITLPAFQPSKTYSSTDVKATVKFSDDSNRDGKRPSTVEVYLDRNGEQLRKKTVTVSSASNSVSFNDLYTYAPGGKKYTYTVRGASVSGYTRSVSGKTITYTHTSATKNVSASVAWSDDSNRDGKRPASVIVTLYKNGTAYKTATASASNSWTVTFSDVYTYESGSTIKYTASGPAVTAYTKSASGTKTTYSHTPETITVAGKILWDDDDNSAGKRPSSVTVTLRKNGGVLKSVSADSSGGYNYSFGSLYRYEAGVMQEYDVEFPNITDYRISEEGYDATYKYIEGLSFDCGFLL